MPGKDTVTLLDHRHINGFQIKESRGPSVRAQRLPRYSVWTPDGRCLEEFRSMASAERWCREQDDFALNH